MGLNKALPQEEQDVVLPIFEGGLYWMHMENLLLSMRGDLDKDVQKKVVKTILEIHHRPPCPQKKPKRDKGAKKTLGFLTCQSHPMVPLLYDCSIDMVEEDRFEFALDERFL
jgi:hypothetical protein